MGVDHYVAAGLLASVLFMLFHWFPWGDLPGRGGKPLPRLVTYTLGMGTVLAITTVMGRLYAVTAGEVLALLWVVALCAGVFTALSWFARWALTRNAAAAQAQVREREARRLDE